ncbi:hypothetical protein RUND412_001411 [Rhizina undulata]
MKTPLLLLSLLILLLSATYTRLNPLPLLTTSLPATSRASLACITLKALKPSKIFFPGSSDYEFERTQHWDKRSHLLPRCVFTPENARDVSLAVKVLTTVRAEFAIRGGGHTPVPGWANIDGGVLFAMGRMAEMSWGVDEDGSEGDAVLKVGAGNIWAPVYEKAGEKGKGVMGGRLGDIGVGGLTLGGGNGYLTGKYGFASDSVVGYEIVTADAKILEVTAQSHPNLFLALKGGSSNFGIVTRFDLATFDLTKVWAGVVNIDYSQVPEALNLGLDAIDRYHREGAKDINSGIIPCALEIPAYGLKYLRVVLFYAEPVDVEKEVPEALRELYELAGKYGTNDDMEVTTLAEFAAKSALDAKGLKARRQSFYTGTVRATPNTIQNIHRVFDEKISPIKSIAGFFLVFTFQPITANSLLSSVLTPLHITENAPSLPLDRFNLSTPPKNLFSMDPANAPYSWVLAAMTWDLPEDDEVVLKAQRDGQKAYMDWAQEHGAGDGFVYLNDACWDQEPIGSYGEEAVAFLRGVAEIYDPEGVFGRGGLLKGGFKI